MTTNEVMVLYVLLYTRAIRNNGDARPTCSDADKPAGFRSRCVERDDIQIYSNANIRFKV